MSVMTMVRNISHSHKGLLITSTNRKSMVSPIWFVAFSAGNTKKKRVPARLAPTSQVYRYLSEGPGRLGAARYSSWQRQVPSLNRRKLFRPQTLVAGPRVNQASLCIQSRLLRCAFSLLSPRRHAFTAAFVWDHPGLYHNTNPGHPHHRQQAGNPAYLIARCSQPLGKHHLVKYPFGRNSIR